MKLNFYKKKKRWGLFFLLITAIAFLFYQPSVKGQNTNTNIMYEVRPIKETSDSHDYFYYQVKPNEKREVAVRIFNHANVEKEFSVALNDASTNKNGMIDYSNRKIKNKTLSLTELTSDPVRTVKVAANSSESVTFVLTLPKETFEGIVLGGIYVEVKEDSNKKQADGSTGIQLNQNLAYAIAIMLQEKLNYNKKDELVLNDLSVDTTQPINNVITLDLMVLTPNVIRNVSTEIKIFKEGQRQPFSVIKKDNMAFAPSDHFTLELLWEKEAIDAGTYTAETTFHSGNDKWVFNKTFTVTKKDEDTIKEKNTEVSTTKQKKIPYETIVLIVVLLFGGAYLYKIKQK